LEIILTDREADVMQILWELGPSIVADVRVALHDELAYTTVLTILRTLETKRYVSHTEEGRGHRYFSTVKQQAARKSALRHLTSKLFKGSTELLFAQLVSERNLKPDQIRRMRELLDKHSDEENS
jgi:BlaI family penicillinase repressor